MVPWKVRRAGVALGACAALFASSCTDPHSSKSSPASAEPPAPESAKRYDEAYRGGVALLEGYLSVPRDSIANNPQAKTDLRAAVQAFDVAVALKPESSTAWWSRGKAEQLLGDHEEAYQSFHRSYKIDEGKNPDSGLQLVLECLETGRGGEAVHLAELTVHNDPENAGMLANLSLAYLINGQIDDAVRASHEAEAMDPEDEAILAAKNRVDDVQSGRRPRPNHISDIVH
jgi:tetratricopeptide (TPR) repeat protein